MIDNPAIESISSLKDRKGEWPPIMEWRAFAEWIGVEEGVVYNWMRKAHLPSVKVGRYPMINVVALVEQLREGE